MQLDFDVFLPAENDSNILELVFFCILLSHHNARFLFLHSFIFVPSFPLGRVAGAAVLRGLEIPHDQQQSRDSSAGSAPRRDQARSEM